ncbi:ribosome maturation factor RimP [Endomicrobium proavitum]|uniref:Ribosome maturation factor RimP n=1 Tax=Endomicrobium proavitum TaxID=1408281 RepID=A0A0G3WJV9_9BACT|nr:ribosome maturation factor RimP [Endomicrobium proavitum]AKL98175.1 Ribosome maturation factor RimP [Endomicrobium proavitum]
MINKAVETENFLAASAESESIEIVDVQYVKEDGDMILRIFIDKDGGVNMNDCERMSRIFSAKLDESSIFSDPYVLEVSSPGIERVLKNEKAFKKFIGSKIKVQTFNPIGNQRNFTGVLLACSDGKIVMQDLTNGSVEIEIIEIKKANLEADF